MSEHRENFSDYLDSLDLPPEIREPVHILAVSGGRRRTDSLEVFPKIEPASEGHFELSFFLHGIRYCERIAKLQSGERVEFIRERKNTGTGLPALRVETLKGEAIGYTPNYMVSDFQYIRENCYVPEDIAVARVNPHFSYTFCYGGLRQILPAFRSILLWTVCTHTARQQNQRAPW